MKKEESSVSRTGSPQEWSKRTTATTATKKTTITTTTERERTRTQKTSFHEECGLSSIRLSNN